MSQNKKPNLHKFAPAYELGPAEEYPPGSIEWAERISQRFQIGAKSITKHTVHHLWDTIEAIWATHPRPWEIWPKDSPFKTPDDYCLAVTGHSWEFLVSMVTEFADGDSSISVEEMRAELAKTQVEYRPQGKHHDYSPLSYKEDGGGISPGGTRATYLLRRLAREEPDILDRYQRGEFKSVRAAAIAAKLITPPTRLDRLKTEWKWASAEDREAFLAWVQSGGP